MFIWIIFSDTSPSCDANVITTAKVYFLFAAQDVIKEAIYSDNMVFETNQMLKNYLTYDILYTCTQPNCKTI